MQLSYLSSYYLRKGGYVFVVVCLPFVCLLATLRKKLRNGFAWNFQASEQMFKFCWRGIRIRIRIATLITRASAEVCTVSVRLVITVLP